jgi:hypothetical protein
VVARRPVDNLDHRNLGMQMQRIEAQEQGLCLKCAQTPDLTNPMDAAEYGLSGLCATCWASIWADDEGDDE